MEQMKTALIPSLQSIHGKVEIGVGDGDLRVLIPEDGFEIRMRLTDIAWALHHIGEKLPEVATAEESA